MKISRTSLLCIALPLMLRAQPPVFSWNLANTKPAAQVNVKLYGQPDAGFYVVNEQPPSGTQFLPTITLEYFNKELERLYVKNITPPALEDYVGTGYMNHQLWLFTALFDKASGKNTLYAGSFGSTVQHKHAKPSPRLMPPAWPTGVCSPLPYLPTSRNWWYLHNPIM